MCLSGLRLRLSALLVTLIIGTATLAGTSGALKKSVSLKKPYPQMYIGARTDKISVQYAVMALLKQVGIQYNWGKSFQNTDPLCRRWITPAIEDVPCGEALTSTLKPIGLAYEIDDTGLFLRRLHDKSPPKGADPAPKPEPPPGVAPDEPKPKLPRQPKTEPKGDWVVEGVGWRQAVVGASREEVIKALGQSEDQDPRWLNYRKRLGIDVFYSGRDRAVEVRFNPGFRRSLRSGIGIGSSMARVFAAYGRPKETRRVGSNGGLFDDRVLYRLPAAAKIIYGDRGVLFWFDRSDKVSQFVVCAPRAGGGPPPIPDDIEKRLRRQVTLTKPYPGSYRNAPTDRISVQYAVIEILKQVGVVYDWDASYKNTNPICRRWVWPNIRNRPCNEALEEILKPVGLSYSIKNGKVVLARR